MVNGERRRRLGDDPEDHLLGRGNFEAPLEKFPGKKAFITNRVGDFGFLIGIFLLINVPLTVVLALLLANALNAPIRGRTFFRSSFYVPYITASVACVAVEGGRVTTS